MPRVDDGLVDQQLGVAGVGGVDLVVVASVGDDGVAGAPGVGIELDHVGFIASDHQLTCPGRQRGAADGLGVAGVEQVLLGQGQQVLQTQLQQVGAGVGGQVDLALLGAGGGHAGEAGEC